MVKILSSFNSKKNYNNGCPFAIKSGGHSANPEAANIESGVTIDLAHLNSTEIHVDAKKASVAPGAWWGDVYKPLEDAGSYTVPGGRVADVGVGGLVLGGGISFLAPRVGFVCDAVSNFEVVLASGKIVNANTTSNKDLFRALKGGSNNFGVVTKIDLPLFDARMWGGLVTTDIRLRQSAFVAFENFTKSATYDENASLFVIPIFANGMWILVLNMVYTLPKITNPPAFEPFLRLPGLSTLRETTHLDLTDELIAHSIWNPPHPRSAWFTLTFKNNAAFMETLYQLAEEMVDKIKDTAGLFLGIEFFPLPQTIIKHGKSNGGNSLGLDAEGGDLVVINLDANWWKKSDDELVTAHLWKMIEEAKDLAKQKGIWDEYLYLNYASRFGSHRTQNVMQSYGSKNLDAMRAVSKRYDPTGLFQKAVPGGFKLWA